jgi:two-component system, response regulator YesN
MPREFPFDVGPRIIGKSSEIIWSSFEYYSPLKRLLEYVSEHPGEALSMAHAARIASLEYTHFAAYFRKKTGVTYKCWIDFVRVCWAVQMLESVDKSITEVAQDSGFEDGTTFCRTFRRVTGMTPTQYRRRRLRRSRDQWKQ